jgi:hypothetical protein
MDDCRPEAGVKMEIHKKGPMIKRWKQARRLLAPFILRGRIGDWWVRRKTKLLEEQFQSELVRASVKPLNAEPPLHKRPRTVLREMLLIGDFMWETNDLVPELAKICKVVAWDLHDVLKNLPDADKAAETVVTTIRSRIQSEEEINPDVILFYARPSLLSEEVFDVLQRRFSCPLLGMNLDDKFQFLDYGIFASGDENYEKWARYFDLNITNGLAAHEWYSLRGLPCIYSPQGVHQPRGLSMPVGVDFKYQIGFLGSCKPERLHVINRLREVGIQVALFGSGWPNGKWVDNTADVFRSTQINIGIGFASPSVRLTTTKGRDFECPGTGACYLTTYNWELAQHYEIGKEILCYRDVEELIEMIAYYRRRPEECLTIAQAAWRRCSNEHTWEKRFSRIFKHMGFHTATS